jgi:hypothetical protein
LEEEEYEIDVGEMDEIIERGSDEEFFLNFPKLKTFLLQSQSKEAIYELDYIIDEKE